MSEERKIIHLIALLPAGIWLFIILLFQVDSEGFFSTGIIIVIIWAVIVEIFAPIIIHFVKKSNEKAKAKEEFEKIQAEQQALAKEEEELAEQIELERRERARREGELARIQKEKMEAEEREKQRQLAEEKRIRKEQLQVKEKSPLLNNLFQLNMSTNFEKIDGSYFYNFYCTSKQSLEHFDFNQELVSKIQESEDYFNGLLSTVYKNEKLWREYQLKLREIREYSSVSLIEDMNYETYHFWEKELFEKHKLNQPITQITVVLSASYTSPTGINSYRKNYSFSHDDIVAAVKVAKKQYEQQMAMILQKNKEKEERRLKEKKLHELEKLEEDLLKKQQQIETKEREFFNATKGHMYSCEQNLVQQNQMNNEKSKSSPLDKIKEIKQLFDNGEISYEEYSAKRKELL